MKWWNPLTWLQRSGERATPSLYEEDQRSLRRWLAFLYLVPAAGVTGIAVYSFAGGTPRATVFGFSLLWSAAAWIFGGFLGFLFAIPQSATRTTANGGEARGYRSNSNLEEVSDWLTKIIVGIGLVELTNLTGAVDRLINFIEPSLGRGTDNDGYILAFLLLFTTCGFLSVYILTRVYLGVLFAQTEGELKRLSEQADAVNRLATQVDTDTKRAAADVEPLAEVPVSVATTVAGVDPGAAAGSARARIIDAIQTLYSVVYGSTMTDIDEAINRLRRDNYMDQPIEELARNLLDLTKGSTTGDAFSIAASTSIADATDKFLRSMSRTASINFENKVEDALKQVLGNESVERRPDARGGRSPDFVVTGHDRRIVVESYLPPRPQPRYLLRRVQDKLDFLDPFDASALLVVVPDGIPLDVLRTDLGEFPQAEVTTLGGLPASKVFVAPA
jgi:hypothetical protein